MASMSRFYASPSNINKLIQMVDGNSVVSLRLIDWFVTNYCKKNNVEIIRRNTNSRYNIYVDYRSQLKAFSKHNFDPFKRRDRIRYFYSNDDFIVTTVGQLNFFKWAIENGVVEYIEDNHNKVEADMAACYKQVDPVSAKVVTPVKQDKKARKKRAELSRSCLKHVNITPLEMCLSFE